MPLPQERAFRLGVALRAAASRREWIEKCRKAEDLGYYTIAVIDHLGLPAPFPALMLAAEATERARLGSVVAMVCPIPDVQVGLLLQADVQHAPHVVDAFLGGPQFEFAALLDGGAVHRLLDLEDDRVKGLGCVRTQLLHDLHAIDIALPDRRAN
jgi:hypothetical protein